MMTVLQTTKRGTFNKDYKNRGISLLEMSFAILILSIIVSGLIVMIGDTYNISGNIQTNKKITIIHDAISDYVLTHSSLPCPAPLNVDMGDNNFGLQHCTDNTVASIISGEDLGVYSIAEGVAPGDTIMVQVGAIPVSSLNLPMEFSHDNWGNRFFYIVNKNLSNVSAREFLGYHSVKRAINIKDRYANDLLPKSANASVAYTIFSTGPKKRGYSYNTKGILNNFGSESAIEATNVSFITKSNHTNWVSVGTNSFVSDILKFGQFDDILSWRTREEIIADMGGLGKFSSYSINDQLIVVDYIIDSRDSDVVKLLYDPPMTRFFLLINGDSMKDLGVQTSDNCVISNFGTETKLVALDVSKVYKLGSGYYIRNSSNAWHRSNKVNDVHIVSGVLKTDTCLSLPMPNITHNGLAYSYLAYDHQLALNIMQVDDSGGCNQIATNLTNGPRIEIKFTDIVYDINRDGNVLSNPYKNLFASKTIYINDNHQMADVDELKHLINKYQEDSSSISTFMFNNSRILPYDILNLLPVNFIGNNIVVSFSAPDGINLIAHVEDLLILKNNISFQSYRDSYNMQQYQNLGSYRWQDIDMSYKSIKDSRHVIAKVHLLGGSNIPHNVLAGGNNTTYLALTPVKSDWENALKMNGDPVSSSDKIWNATSCPLIYGLQYPKEAKAHWYPLYDSIKTGDVLFYVDNDLSLIEKGLHFDWFHSMTNATFIKANSNFNTLIANPTNNCHKDNSKQSNNLRFINVSSGDWGISVAACKCA